MYCHEKYTASDIVNICFSSCNKSYKYVETVKEKSLFSNSYNEKEEEPKTISSKNDSLAYLEAYQNFAFLKKFIKI